METPFDLASLTKPMVTAFLATQFASTNRWRLDDPLRRFVATQSAATVADTLGHASGLPAHLPFYHTLAPGDYQGLVRRVGTTDCVAAPRAHAIYSDLGYILLGAALENVGQARLDQLIAPVFAELGIGARYVNLAGALRPHAVATERDDQRGLLCGEVHDENCHRAGGVAGHAGLFGSLRDVARFAEIMLRIIGGERLAEVSPEVVRRAITTSPARGSWRLGWDTPSGEQSTAGDRWSRHGIGHLGFTGTSLWLDPARGRWVVLLTNRIHPTRGETAAPIRQLRRAVMDACSVMLDR